MYITIETVFIVVSILYAILLYFVLGNGNTITFGGVLLAGLVLLIKGHIDKKQVV